MPVLSTLLYVALTKQNDDGSHSTSLIASCHPRSKRQRTCTYLCAFDTATLKVYLLRFIPPFY